MNIDAFKQELRKVAAELREQAEKLRRQERMEKRASYHVDIEALKRLIHGKA